MRSFLVVVLREYVILSKAKDLLTRASVILSEAKDLLTQA
jgi:hypothetical protein